MPHFLQLSVGRGSTPVLLPRALRPVGKVSQGAPTRGRSCAYNRGTQAKKPMTETLDFATLALLDALESDLEVPDFDADELLDDEA